MLARHLFAIAIAAGLGVNAEALAQDQPSGSWRDLYLDARPILDVRYRFERVEQDSRPETAEANTIRTRAGFETGRFHGVGLGFNFESVAALGDDDFNDTVNGRTRFPVVADPDDLQVNELYLDANGTIPKTRVKLGRQRIIWDNARFIGNVGFRQNEQTFDAARAFVFPWPELELEYDYLEEVHRIFGTDSDVGELEMSSHGARIHYRPFAELTVTPFALLLDFERAAFARSSSASGGILLDGGTALDDDWRLLYSAGAAYQEDFADNPGDFGLWYAQAEAGLGYAGIQGRLGYELLQGDGTDAFQTPLATLHKFNGLTDQFLTTPPDGLQDLYLKLDAKLPGDGWLADFSLKGGYHQFWADEGGAHYGSEWDLGLFKAFKTDYGKVLLGVQYADYDADSFSSDTQKLWLTVQVQAAAKPFRDYLSD